MAAILYAQFRSYDIKELVTRLNEGYYNALDIMCLNAHNCIGQLQEDDQHPSVVLYTSIYSALLTEIQDLLLFRRDVILPYLEELIAKSEAGHNCKECSGKCHVGHNVHLMSLKNSHDKIKDVLAELQSSTLPLHMDVEYPAAYRILRNEIAVIDNMLIELFYIEESSLIPKVMETQKSINA